MNEMIRLGQDIYQKYQLQNKTVIVAVSTGVDSTVLLNVLEASPISNENLIVAHVNHEIRKQSDEEEQFLKNWCDKHHVKIQIAHWPKNQHPLHGVEAAARAFRYQFFQKIMKNYDNPVLLTAHNADEQVETFLMRLTRGGVINELQGIPKNRKFANGVLIRPFLKIEKATLIKIAKNYHLQWFEDQTNHTNEFLRNRLRNQIITMLKQENHQFVSHIINYQTQLQEQSLLIDEAVSQKIKKLKNDAGYSRIKFKALTLIWQKKIITKLINDYDGSISLNETKLLKIIDIICKFSQGQTYFDLGHANKMLITYDYFNFSSKGTAKDEQSFEYMVTLDKWFSILGYQFKATKSVNDIQNKQQVMILSANQVNLPLSIRTAQLHDVLRLKSGGYKTVRREMIDQKIPMNKRNRFLAVVDSQDNVLWVLNLRKAWLKEPFKKQLPIFTLEWKFGGSPRG